MIAEFAKRRGYDMQPWLPVLAGRVVESAEASDRFLWDFRKTLGDLIAEISLRPADRHPEGARHGAATPSRTSPAAPSSATAWRSSARPPFR